MWVDCSIWLRFGCDLAARTVELPRKFVCTPMVVNTCVM